MSELFLLTDQHNNYLNKEGVWISPAEASQHPAALFRTTLKDEAINQKVEYIVKNPELRIAVASVPSNDKGLPALDIDANSTAEDMQAELEISETLSVVEDNRLEENRPAEDSREESNPEDNTLSAVTTEDAVA